MKTNKCGYLGPEGTFSEQAAMKYCSKEDLFSLRSFNEIFEKLQTGEITRGVIPIENSLEGAVKLCMDLLYSNSYVVVVDEIIVPIKHYLMAPAGTKINDIKELYSIAQIIGQTNKYINQNLKEVQIKYTASSAQAAEIIDGNNTKAMIGSKRISELYDLEILAEGIEDMTNNYTRFLVVANKLDVKDEFPEMDKEYKTSIICAPTINEAGVLYSILSEFKRENINLTRIESRPTKRQLGEYVFYIDFEGHQKNRHVRVALDAIEKKSVFFKILGSYIKGEIE
ncbi:prephenate dehydratase [Natronospora cellulosivora (SeqCode)]